MAGFGYVQSNILHKKREDNKPKEVIEQQDVYTGIKIDVLESLQKTRALLNQTVSNLTIESLSGLKSNLHTAYTLNEQTSNLKANIPLTISKLRDDEFESGHYYVQIIDYLREMAKCSIFVTKESYNYVNNNHPKLIEKQIEELQLLQKDASDLVQNLAHLIETKDLSIVNRIHELQKKVLDSVTIIRENQLKRIKKKIVGTRNSMMYLGILSEYKNMMLYSLNLMKAHNEFMSFKTKKR